ncbi:MAG: GH25 family lysozyme [Mobilitalea sp.]
MKKSKLWICILLTFVILQLSFGMAKAAETTESPFTDDSYTYSSEYKDYTILHGIDVSKYQGKIDWAKVKKAGVDFTFIRLGYRGYGSAGNIGDDGYFDINMQGSINAGVSTGVYFFSQAITTKEAVEEARYALARIEDYDVTMPVVIDFEYAYVNAGTGGRLYNAKLTKAEATAICMAFCKTIADAGYAPMVYANLYMLTNKLDAAAISKKYSIWCAYYSTASSISYPFWQYSSSGKVDGIATRIDCDLWFKKPEELVINTETVVNMSFSDSISTYPYTNSAITPEVTVTSYQADSKGILSEAKTLISGKDYTLTYSNNSKIGTAMIKAELIGIEADQTDLTKTFQITTNDIAKYTYSKVVSQQYTGLAITPKFTVTNEESKLASGTDYKVTCSNNKSIGTATMVITGQGNYTGIKKIRFYILPKQMTSFQIAANSTSSIKLKWSKVTNATGYVIYRASSASGTYTRIKTIQSNSILAWTNTRLSKAAKYYYRARAYKTVNGKYYFGAYAKVLTAATDSSYAQQTTKTGTVTASSLTIRKGAGTSYAAITEISKGTSVKVISTRKDSKGNLWYRIYCKKHNVTYTGYVYGGYIKLS